MNSGRTARDRKDLIKQQEKTLGKKFSRQEYKARLALYTVEDARDSWKVKLENAEVDVKNSKEKMSQLKGDLKNAVAECDDFKQDRIVGDLELEEQRLNSANNNVHLIKNPYSLLARYATEVEFAYKRNDFPFICKNVPVDRLDNMGSIAGSLDDALLKQITETINNVLKAIDEHNERARKLGSIISAGNTATEISQPNKSKNKYIMEAEKSLQQDQQDIETEKKGTSIKPPILDPTQAESVDKNKL